MRTGTPIIDWFARWQSQTWFPYYFVRLWKKIISFPSCEKTKAPWLESILLELGAASVTTIEYNKIVSLVKNVTVYSPEEVRTLWQGKGPMLTWCLQRVWQIMPSNCVFRASPPSSLKGKHHMCTVTNREESPTSLWCGGHLLIYWAQRFGPLRRLT